MSCRGCAHLKRPGRVDAGYCAGRTDLPPAYGDGHPLRKIPPTVFTGEQDCLYHKDQKDETTKR